MRAIALLVVVSAAFASPQPVLDPPIDPARTLALALRRIGAEGRLLYVTAHPDDEDNGLLACYRHGYGFSVHLLTLTRGEGGQNEIGEELDEALGVLRSEELRSAHRFDGAVQHFSRAFEFGYSFSETETFEKWGEEAILRDVVRVVRSVRPHVIVTMPAVTLGGGRHHQASAFAARRAFDLAAQEIWPDLGEPWAVQRLFEQVWSTPVRGEDTWTARTDDYDPILGCTYAEIGFRARSLHKCQGAGQVPPVTGRSRPRVWRLVMHRGDAGADRDDLFAGLPVYRDARSGELGPTRMDPFGPSGPPPVARPDLVAGRLRELLLGSDPAVRDTLWDALAHAIPVAIDARADRDEVAPGDAWNVTVAVTNRSRGMLQIDALLLEGRLHAGGPRWLRRLVLPDGKQTGRLAPGERVLVKASIVVPRDADDWTAVSLVKEPDKDRYAQAPPGLPELGAYSVRMLGDVEGLPLRLDGVPVLHWTEDPGFPEARSTDLVLLPGVEVRLRPSVVPVPWTTEGSVAAATVVVEARVRGNRTARVRIGWRGLGAPESTEDGVTLSLDDGERREVSIPVVTTEGSGPVTVAAWVVDDETTGAALSTRAIRYPHIRRAYLREPATALIVPFPCHVPDVGTVGWVEGSGDRVDDCLEWAGLVIKRLSPLDLLESDLSRFQVIVTGVRAYKVRDDLKRAHPRLLDWMRSGGRLVVLYNKSPDMNAGTGARGGSPWVPYTARISGNRATVEEAPVILRDPDHPFFHRPNPITALDWAGWVQERGLYFLETRDDRYQDLLWVDEPWPGNRGRKSGSLVTAKVGEGSWSYVGLALFRQLPAGVPGAYRLLMNILAGP